VSLSYSSLNKQCYMTVYSPMFHNDSTIARRDVSKACENKAKKTK